jgi:hypothetical protein
MILPDRCVACGAYLQGGATIHQKDCPFYPISVVGLQETEEGDKNQPEGTKKRLSEEKDN